MILKCLANHKFDKIGTMKEEKKIMGVFKTGKKSMSLLMSENKALKKEIVRLTLLCDRKDACFKELMSDALRHGSPLAAKHMVERSMYLRGK